MSWRTVIVESQSKLDYKMGYLVVRGQDTHRVLLDEILNVVIANPAVSITGCLIEKFIEYKIKVIFCDSKRNPSAELIPHHGSHDSSAKIRAQIVWNDEIKAFVWQEIVTEKIRKQAEFLIELGKNDESQLLQTYIGQVELLDATNREGHAAKVYFNAIWGMQFTRGEDSAINSALNYGYSLILSAFNREISANGYLTQLGIFHNNMFNHFNLGSDLMEPYRIIVDKQVQKMNPEEFGTKEKHELWRILEYPVYINGMHQTVANAIKIYSKSVFDAINDYDSSEILHYQFV